MSATCTRMGDGSSRRTLSAGCTRADPVAAQSRVCSCCRRKLHACESYKHGVHVPGAMAFAWRHGHSMQRQSASERLQSGYGATRHTRGSQRWGFTASLACSRDMSPGTCVGQHACLVPVTQLPSRAPCPTEARSAHKLIQRTSVLCRPRNHHAQLLQRRRLHECANWIHQQCSSLTWQHGASRRVAPRQVARGPAFAPRVERLHIEDVVTRRDMLKRYRHARTNSAFGENAFGGRVALSGSTLPKHKRIILFVRTRVKISA